MTRPLTAGRVGEGGLAGSGTISLIDSPTDEIDVLNPAGPTASLSINSIGISVKVATLADLDAVTTGSPVRTLTTPITLAGAVALPVGESLVVTALTPIRGLHSTLTGFTGNVSGGPVISGPLFAQDIFVVNADVTGSLFSLSGALGEVVFLENILCQGVGPGATVGSIVGILGDFAFNNVLCNGFTVGWTMDGTLGAWRIFQCAFTSSAPTMVGFEILPTAALTTIGLFDDCSLTNAAPTEILFRFSDAATYPTPAPPTDILSIEMSNCRASGAAMLDESPGNLTSRSGELLIRGGVGTRASDYIGGVGFLDPALPLTVAYGGIDTFTELPYTDGVTTFIESTAMERFAFVRASTGGPPDPLFPLDWALKYMFGPSNVDVALTFNTSVRNGAGGGTPNVQARIEYDPGATLAWVTTAAVGLLQQQNRLLPLTATTSIFSGVSPGDQFRWVSAVDIGPTDTVVALFDLFATVRSS